MATKKYISESDKNKAAVREDSCSLFLCVVHFINRLNNCLKLIFLSLI